MSHPEVPWKTLQARTVFQNQYLKVREDIVRQPDGKRGTYAYMDHGGGVGAVVLDAKFQVYLLEEYKYPVRAFGLHLPSGGIDLGETALHAAKRELMEEIGFTAKKWRTLGTLAVSDSMSTEIAHLFLAQDITTARIAHPPLEPLKIVQMPLRKAVKLALDGQITCAYAVVGLLRAAAKLKVL